jgi:hypothetical protein
MRTLRSMLAGRIGAHENAWRLLKFSRYGFELDPDAWTEQWSRYIERALARLDAPLLAVTSLRELERVARLLPGATFSLNLGIPGGDIDRVRALAGSPLLSSLTRLICRGGIDDGGGNRARAFCLPRAADVHEVGRPRDDGGRGEGARGVDRPALPDVPEPEQRDPPARTRLEVERDG